MTNSQRSSPENRIPALEDWHAFVDQYSNLIFSVIRRYLVKESEDDWRTVYVNTLKVFYEGKLTGFDGRAAMSTWVTLITRSRSLDFLRSKYGRRDLPSWLGTSGELDQEVYRLYYLEGWGLRHIGQKLARDGEPLPAEDLVEILRRFENRFDRGARRRLAYELHGRTVGAQSGLMLEYLDDLQEEWRAKGVKQSPDRALEQGETLAGVERLRNLLAELPAAEQEVIELRYFQGYSAKRISSRMQLAGPRRAYTLIDRGLRRLRTLFEGQNQGPRVKAPKGDLRARTDGRP